MMDNRNGFTLLELLIAAALIGVLAMFATQAFRASSSEVRVEDAKSRARALVAAAQRYYIEYPTAAFFKSGSENDLEGFVAPRSCNIKDNDPQQLVNCGFLEYRQLTQETREKENGDWVYYGSVTMWFDFNDTTDRDTVKVCFKGKGRILDKCTYCTTGSGFSQVCSDGE